MIVCGRGDTATAARPQSSQSVSRSLGAEASHQASHPSRCQLIFWGGGRIIHLDGTLPHPTTPLRLMETDIRKNVRECVRSSEKVRLDVCVCVCVCLGVRAVRVFGRGSTRQVAVETCCRWF